MPKDISEERSEDVASSNGETGNAESAFDSPVCVLGQAKDDDYQ